MRKETVAGILAVSLGCLAVASPTRAEQPRGPIPHLSEGKIVEANAYPWSAVGKLNNGIGGSCTAVMVSPKHALTAAHCLYFRNTGRFLPPRSFHLVLGYQRQGYRDHLRISAYYVPPNYDPKKPYESLEHDWALLSVASYKESNSSSPPVKVPIGNTPSINSTLMTAGYSHRTPYAMTADQDCKLVGQSLNRKFLFDTCKAPSGFSGAPVLVSDPETKSVSIAGIHVANQHYKTNEVGIAIPIENVWREIKSCVQANQCQFQHVATGRDPSAAEVLASMGSRQAPPLQPSCQPDDPNCRTALSGP